VKSINGDPAAPASFEELHELIKTQTFRLANWRVASDDINYRRFFDTNHLAGLCTEREAVFQATHRLVLGLVAEGKVDGFRIDHPDGLYDPAQYFADLQRGIAAAASRDANPPPHYIVIEKILMGRERLPAQWPVCGTTGYDFANLVNGLFVDSSATMRLERIYRRFIGDEIDVDDLLYRCRKLIMQVNLASELNVIANKIAKIALSKRRTCDFTLNRLRDALTEVVASFPVYRTYVSASGVSESDETYIHQAIAAAKRRSPAADTSIFDFLAEVLLTHIADGQDEAYRNAVTAFSMKFQQFTGPVMAKGVEDTALYRYNRLISLNDVGSDLHRFGTSVKEFHAANELVFRDWPHTMLDTSTHDSKRSEDVRARINALSEVPGLWRLRVWDWSRFNRIHKHLIGDRFAPSPNEEYLLYQTLIGAWPMEPLTSESDWQAFRKRIESYMLKAVREAKENTSWINRNTEYEAAVSSFVEALLTPGDENIFLNSFVPFQRRIGRVAVWNSLAQTLLKLTCPGVPDIYQGNELWDFSLVDPDNRRPVDYARRRQLFEGLRDGGDGPCPCLFDGLLRTPEDGQIKLYLTWKTLHLRQRLADLFQQGEYLPLWVAGPQADHVIAFARRLGTETVFVAAPRMVAGLLDKVEDPAPPPVGPEIWGDTQLVLPFCDPKKKYRNQFTGKLLEVERQISVSQAFADFPLALYAPLD
jgi:(1->4)-alpha-D-glucan 1-alpha-D-glucosylmutase